MVSGDASIKDRCKRFLSRDALKKFALRVNRVCIDFFIWVLLVYVYSICIERIAFDEITSQGQEIRRQLLLRYERGGRCHKDEVAVIFESVMIKSKPIIIEAEVTLKQALCPWKVF